MDSRRPTTPRENIDFWARVCERTVAQMMAEPEPGDDGPVNRMVDLAAFLRSTELRAALDLADAHEWCTANDVCVQRVGYHEEVEGVPPHTLGWCVLTGDGMTDAYAATFIEAVAALRKRLQSEEDSRGNDR